MVFQCKLFMIVFKRFFNDLMGNAKMLQYCKCYGLLFHMRKIFYMYETAERILEIAPQAFEVEIRFKNDFFFCLSKQLKMLKTKMCCIC